MVAVIDMACPLNLGATAEEIETHELLAEVIDLGSDLAGALLSQGYFFGGPHRVFGVLRRASAGDPIERAHKMPPQLIAAIAGRDMVLFRLDCGSGG